MTCHVNEKDVNEIYTSCVLDYGNKLDCSVAIDLYTNGKTRNDCEHWRGVKLPKQHGRVIDVKETK